MASGPTTPDTPGDAGGLIVMVRPDPAVAARSIADDLRAELAVGGHETEAAVARLAALHHAARDLDGLADAMRRADAVRERTRTQVATAVSQRLNTTVAIHPDTIRRAATELVAAELALEAAVAGDERRRRRARRGGAGSGAAVAGAGVAVAAVVAPPVGAAVVAVGALGGTAAWWRGRRLPVAGHPSLRAHCAVARTRWEQVAGVGADPLQVEAVIHRYDPQDGIVAALVDEHPAVRAVERAAIARRVAWVAAWRAEVGDDSPIADPALADLLHQQRAQLWLGAGSPFELTEPETLVVAAPYAELPEARARDLHRRLLALPRGVRVIVVLAPDASTPEGAGAVVPGVGWERALTAGSPF